ncbi:MAG: uroporphyrinogen decarboxylase [Gemmatimonadetes bacterium]|nr:uroporphyrinogen decarboxylase [Gemmatimonadota bacterium]
MSGTSTPSSGSPLKNDLFLRAARGESTERPPVWMMRQAGRYLPQYRAVRAKADFLTMCRTPELAVEVTLQPVELLKVDAAIIFSDILVVPQAMGMELHMDEGIGPQFPDPLRRAADLTRLREVAVEEDLGYMLDAVRLCRRELDGRVPLIGFAGAPWTLASYMIEGKGTKNFHVAKRLIVEAPEMAHALLSKLATVVGNFLVAQVRAGAQAVQLFDSWAGALAPAEFRQFALPYLARSCAIARTAGVPVTVFAPGAGWALEQIVEASGCDVVGVDWQVEPADARRRLAAHRVALQGNLDPSLLFGTPDFVRHRTRKMLDAFGSRGYIANLGHGILPETPVASARAFIDTVREWSAPASQPTVSPVPYGRSSAMLA